MNRVRPREALHGLLEPDAVPFQQRAGDGIANPRWVKKFTT
jgi:hypothetical protein